MGNAVFFWVKKLIERWYLLFTEKFLFWTFQWWEIRSFFQLKCWWKDDIYLVFLSFPWYSRAWEIWFRAVVLKSALADHTWKWNQILCDFFFIASENFRYFLFNPSKFHISFVPIFLENPSPGITNFVTSFEQTNFWSWDTKENNLEYLLFGINTNLLAICSSFSLFCRYLKKTLKPTKFYSRFWIRRKLTL